MIIGYRLSDPVVDVELRKLAQDVLEFMLNGTDWTGLQLTVMSDGSITYDVQTKAQSKGGE